MGEGRGNDLLATFAASETAARAWVRPAEAVTVSGASSELSASSSSGSVGIFAGPAVKESSGLVDEGVVVAGFRPSGPNLLWVALEGLGEGSVAGVSSVGAGVSSSVLRFLMNLPFLDDLFAPVGIGASVLTTPAAALEGSPTGGDRLIGTALPDFNIAGSNVSLTRASFELGAGCTDLGDEIVVSPLVVRSTAGATSFTKTFRLLLVADLLGDVSKLFSAFLFLPRAGFGPFIEGPCTSLLGRAWSWLLVDTIVFSTASASSACSCFSPSTSECGFIGVFERVKNIRIESKKRDNIINQLFGLWLALTCENLWG